MQALCHVECHLQPLVVPAEGVRAQPLFFREGIAQVSALQETLYLLAPVVRQVIGEPIKQSAKLTGVVFCKCRARDRTRRMRVKQLNP